MYAAKHECGCILLIGGNLIDAGGVDDVSLFTDNLIEEPDAMLSQGSRQAMVSFMSFLEQVNFEILQFIQHEM